MKRRRQGLWSKTVGSVERAFLVFVQRYSLVFLRYSLVAVLVWFGLLTAAGRGDTASLFAVALGLDPSPQFLLALGLWEAGIGVALLSRQTDRLAAVMMGAYAVVTLAPLVTATGHTFTHFPYAPSFEGVYIIKNWVLLGGVMTVGGASDG